MKEKTLPNLQKVTYWRIVRINHVSKNGTDVVLGGFASKDVSDQVGDLGYLDVANFPFTGEQISKTDFIEGNPYVIIYGLIKESRLNDKGVETNWFADAEDA